MSSKNAKARERAERAARALAEAKKREQKRNIYTGLAVVLAIVLIVGGAVFISKLKGDQDNAKVSSAIPAFGESDYGLVVGDTSAPHSVIIYEDFLCPICGAFEAEFDAKAQGLVEQGKLSVEYRPFVLLDGQGPYSADSLNAFYVVLDAAGDDVAKKFHDLLYLPANQPQEGGPYPDSAALVALAVQAGADEAEVKDAIESGAQSDKVSAATDDAFGDGVKSTPTVILDGQVLPPTAGRIDTIVAAASATETGSPSETGSPTDTATE